MEVGNPLEARTANQIRALYRRARDSRRNSGWEVGARDAVDFRFGNQLTSQEHTDMQNVGQPDIVLDRIHAAIDRMKAFLTARNPKFSALPREDSDQKMASTWRIILEYIWDISEGNVQFKQAVDDYATVGVGYMMGYIDRDADAGKGEVKVKCVPWASVYWDSSARERLYGDAQYCILSAFVTRYALISQYPKLGEIHEGTGKQLIDTITSTEDDDEDFPTSNRYNINDIQTPSEIKDLDFWNKRHKILTYFEPTKVPFYWIKEGESERLINQEQLQQLYGNQEFAIMVTTGAIQIKEVQQTRWRETAVLGQHILYSNLLNTDICPVIPFPNIWTGTPYPKSDINKNKDAQRLLNKIVSTITMHLQTSAGSKLLIPEGSVEDIGELERNFTNPTYVGQFNPEFGQPVVIQTTPLASEAYYLIDRLEHYIDLNFGINELAQGFKGGTTGAVRTDLMLKDEGESRGKSKLQDIEASLSRVGKVIKNLAQGHYRIDKLFQIAQPNGSKPRETRVNIYTPRENEIAQIANDITLGEVDVKVVAGSSLPSNRQVEEATAMEAFKLGLVRKPYVWRKMELDNYEEMMKEDSEIAQLSGQVESMTEQIKKMEGQQQVMERELRHKDRMVAKAKFVADLDEIEANARANAKVQSGTLGARISTIADKAKLDADRVIASLEHERVVQKDAQQTKS